MSVINALRALNRYCRDDQTAREFRQVLRDGIPREIGDFIDTLDGKYAHIVKIYEECNNNYVPGSTYFDLNPDVEGRFVRQDHVDACGYRILVNPKSAAFGKHPAVQPKILSFGVPCWEISYCEFIAKVSGTLGTTFLVDGIGSTSFSRDVMIKIFMQIGKSELGATKCCDEFARDLGLTEIKKNRQHIYISDAVAFTYVLSGPERTYAEILDDKDFVFGTMREAVDAAQGDIVVITYSMPEAYAIAQSMHGSDKVIQLYVVNLFNDVREWN